MYNIMINLDKVLESKDSLEEIQRILSAETVTGQTPSGKIKVVLSCDKTLKDVIIDQSLNITNADQVLALSKAIMTAFNDADSKITIRASELISSATNTGL
jgi:nucleoid-associated protein EbfC